MEVVPVISEAPLIVPEVITGLVNILLVNVSEVARPTKVSVVVGRVRVPVLTIVPIKGDVSVLLVRISAAASVTTTPVAGKVAVELTPVPPFVDPNVPEVINPAEWVGRSDAANELPAVTRPFVSTVTLT